MLVVERIAVDAVMITPGSGSRGNSQWRDHDSAARGKVIGI